MDQKQAISKLKKLIGPRIGYRINKHAVDSEARATAEVLAAALRERHAEAVAARRAYYEALIARDAEYQRLKAEADRLAKELAEQRSIAHVRRIQVGRVINTGGFSMFEIEAEADTWADVVEAVAAKKVSS